MKALTSGGIRERVAERLRDAIVRGELKPGDSLKDVDLAQTLNTSRGPVREALLQLEKESLSATFTTGAGSSSNCRAMK